MFDVLFSLSFQTVWEDNSCGRGEGSFQIVLQVERVLTPPISLGFYRQNQAGLKWQPFLRYHESALASMLGRKLMGYRSSRSSEKDKTCYYHGNRGDPEYFICLMKCDEWHLTPRCGLFSIQVRKLRWILFSKDR